MHALIVSSSYMAPNNKQSLYLCLCKKECVEWKVLCLQTTPIDCGYDGDQHPGKCEKEGAYPFDKHARATES